MAFHIKIGNYRFSKNLGTGSFGKVKLAFNEVTGHKVAVKILNKKKIKQQGVFEKVKREIKVLRQFNHPHIIKHYEFIDTPSDIFMVIEFASGGELFDLISRRKRLPEDEARLFFQQIFSSIEYTHAHKITHRDLKPENILLDENNNIKLIDFGLANSMKDSLALKTACGSPNYAAPEVISGRSYGGVEVDIWSLGVILYAMVCGSSPFDDESMSALFAKIKDGKYYMPNFISTDVQDLINRMLQPNPVKRISMREIKEHPWYLKDLPQYLQDLQFQHSRPPEIDREIVAKLFQLAPNLQERSEEEVIKAIKDKKNTDFCGIYELFYHDKLKKECFKLQHQYDDDPYANDPMFMSSKQSDCSSSTTSKRPKHFKTLRHMLMHQEVDKHSAAPKSNQSHHSFNQQTSNSDTPMLLTQKHNDRLSRIVRKFRTGEINKNLNDPFFAAKNGKSALEQQLGAGHEAFSMASTRLETLTVTPLNIVHNTVKTTDKLFIARQPVPRAPQRWVCGLIFKGTPIDLMTLTCEVLQQLDIEWQFIPKDLKMKCRSRIDEHSVMDYESSLLMDAQDHGGDDPLANSNKDEMIKEFLRKNFLKFYINIYKDMSQDQPSSQRSHMMGSKGANSNSGGGHNNFGSTLSGSHSIDDTPTSKYMLDIHLFKGTVYVFMEFVSHFIHMITASCSVCSQNNSGCASSNHSSSQHMDRMVMGNNHPHDYKLKLLV